jgi:hypothetical protein
MLDAWRSGGRVDTQRTAGGCLGGLFGGLSAARSRSPTTTRPPLEIEHAEENPAANAFTAWLRRPVGVRDATHDTVGRDPSGAMTQGMRRLGAGGEGVRAYSAEAHQTTSVVPLGRNHHMCST